MSEGVYMNKFLNFHFKMKRTNHKFLFKIPSKKDRIFMKYEVRSSEVDLNSFWTTLVKFSPRNWGFLVPSEQLLHEEGAQILDKDHEPHSQRVDAEPGPQGPVLEHHELLHAPELELQGLD